MVKRRDSFEKYSDVSYTFQTKKRQELDEEHQTFFKGISVLNIPFTSSSRSQIFRILEILEVETKLMSQKLIDLFQKMNEAT